MSYYGGVEAGGTKFICAISDEQGKIERIARLETKTPDETIGEALKFFVGSGYRLEAVGIGTFGPVNLDVNSPSYGSITNTPKKAWRNVDLVSPFRDNLKIPVAFDTDVNVAAFGEYIWGNAQQIETFVYLTIGTGIGGGAIVNGEILHGLVHPEMGHIKVPRHPDDDFRGACPFHGDCLEGMASGSAMERRWGIPASRLSYTHQAWEFESYYLAWGVANIIYTLSPQRVIMGGGVMQNPNLLRLVRENVVKILNGYIQSEMINESIEEYIVSPLLGGKAGVLGAIAMAMKERFA